MNVFWRDLAGLHCCHWLISEDLIPQTKVNKTEESADAYYSWHNLQSDAFMLIINENNCFFLLFRGDGADFYCPVLTITQVQNLLPPNFKSRHVSEFGIIRSLDLYSYMAY